MTQPLAQSGQINGDAFDRYTLVHGASGVLFGVLGFNRISTLAVAVAWEMGENTLKDSHPTAFPNATHDRAVNQITDVLAMSIGREIGAWIMRRRGVR